MHSWRYIPSSSWSLECCRNLRGQVLCNASGHRRACRYKLCYSLVRESLQCFRCWRNSNQYLVRRVFNPYSLDLFSISLFYWRVAARNKGCGTHQEDEDLASYHHISLKLFDGEMIINWSRDSDEKGLQAVLIFLMLKNWPCDCLRATFGQEQLRKFGSIVFNCGLHGQEMLNARERIDEDDQ